MYTNKLAPFPLDKSITPPEQLCINKYVYNPTKSNIAQVPQTASYYYSVTGDIQTGDNQGQSEFNYNKSRFSIDQPLDIITQGKGWNPYVASFEESGGSTPNGMYNTIQPKWNSLHVAPNITINEENMPVINANWAPLGY